MTARLESLTTRLIRVPLHRPWGPDVTSIAIVETTVRDTDGAQGFGFSWTPSIGAEAAQALLDHDIARFAVGRETDPEALWPELWAHLHEAGSGGLTTIAMAGLDLALWDLAGRRTDRPLTAMLRDAPGDDEAPSEPEVYGSGVNLHYPLPELVAQAERWVSADFQAVKMKVGSPELADDVARVRAVREVIGPDRRLMIDANQRWDLDRAVRALDALAEFDLRWIEEPLRADDLPAHETLRARTSVPIALGENVHTRYRVEEFLRAGVVDVLQPNAVRVGGVTPFQQIAALARTHDVEVAPHLLLELSGQLAAAFPPTVSRPLVEAVEDAGFAHLGILADPSPVVVDGDRMHVTDHPGLGLRFTPDPARAAATATSTSASASTPEPTPTPRTDTP
ncbi:mandelate racemase/muconate lactonizing enzyme family protein [Herbiconiux sp. VKM Ac-1786]|uniref:mandelate racemase/muconate lactonizing enzyme family protein n=1 Tax=Herbiconiux sp. VKM Ac-1786 TaxID=2783824 RepID=UPI00188BF3BE|nr:mandelate racemase/muconate lactonizing enzyme family protein [Herbiconiux sp. VKM Ac-1786]MBF4574283.1 mandelate racemase/muconate lactonizing enzyme family protein [Herbiconiux sp. VKM Ac-1786]